jgi:hypothetical protein
MRKLRLFLYSFLVVITIILAYFYFCPLGDVTYKHDFSKKHYNFLGGQGFFHKLGPAERIANKNKIIGDPAYLYLRAPSRFSSANLKLKYKISPELLNSEEFLNIEAGVLLDKDNWRFALYPVFNNYLEKLLSEWDAQEKDGVIFYQREKKFDNYLDFLKQKDFSRTAFYNYNVDYDYIIKNYQPQRVDDYLNIENIRGSYSFFTYIKNEDLNFDFDFSVYSEALSSLSLYVYFYNNIIFSQNLLDSKGEDVNNINYNLNLKDLPEGVYKVEIRSGDNFITKKLSTSNSKLVFLNKIWLSGLENGWEVFSNRSNFRIKTLEADCLGEIDINSEKFIVDKIYQQFNFSLSDNSSDLNKITSNSCGLLIENSGLFSFTADSFFNPLPQKLEEGVDLNKFDFIIAKYKKPQTAGEYFISEIDINLNNAFKDKDGYQFIISAPFLKDLVDNKFIELKKIEIKLKKRILSF